MGGGESAWLALYKNIGGTSVADVERIKHVARRVKAEVDAGNQVAVVVSAMAGETDKLVALTEKTAASTTRANTTLSCHRASRSRPACLRSHFRISACRHAPGSAGRFRSRTDDVHGKARIEGVEGAELVRRLEDGQVAVVAGFQGLGPDKRITTLGRGGSDTSAVALAAALNADRCDILKDVEGIYTADPRIVAKARKLDKITYEEMLEMASLGAKVLQTRAVEMAMKHHVRLLVGSSFTNEPGTLVVDEDEIVEQAVVSGLTYNRNEAKVTLSHVADRPGVAAGIFGPLAEANINVDMIVQSSSEDGKTTDLTFTVAKGELEQAVKVLEAQRKKLGYEKLSSDPNVVKVSVIGVGMRSHAGVAQRMFKALAKEGINIQVISTSEIKVSVLIDEKYAELALRALHAAYGLDGA